MEESGFIFPGVKCKRKSSQTEIVLVIRKVQGFDGTISMRALVMLAGLFEKE
jgi:hypothetical protein